MTQAFLRPYAGLRVEDYRTKLTVTHNNKDLIFMHPAYGRGTYADVKAAIGKDSLRPPTMAENASLIYAVFDSDCKYSVEIKDIMAEGWLWAFTGTLYVPNKGAFIQDDPKIRRGMPFMDRESLEQKLNAKDPSVRFVRFGYQVGEMSFLKLAKNPYVIALAGEEGAEKLAKALDKYKVKPFLQSFGSVDKITTRVSALDFWNLGIGLDVDGDKHGGDLGGSAFGVFVEKATEGGAKNSPAKNR